MALLSFYAQLADRTRKCVCLNPYMHTHTHTSLLLCIHLSNEFILRPPILKQTQIHLSISPVPTCDFFFSQEETTSHLAHTHLDFVLLMYSQPHIPVRSCFADWSICAYFFRLQAWTCVSLRVLLSHLLCCTAHSSWQARSHLLPCRPHWGLAAMHGDVFTEVSVSAALQSSHRLSDHVPGVA